MYPDRLHPYSPFLSTYNHSQEVCRFFNNQKTFAAPLNTRGSNKGFPSYVDCAWLFSFGYCRLTRYWEFLTFPTNFKIPLFAIHLKQISQNCLSIFSYIPIVFMLYINSLYLFFDYRNSYLNIPSGYIPDTIIFLISSTTSSLSSL